MTDQRVDVALCYGTRPQIIKASVVRRALTDLGVVLAVDTGQHYDYELNALLYEQLGVLPPDEFLDVGSGSQATQTGAVMSRAEALLTLRRPRVAVVIGDTNSTVGAALAAAKLRIPVVHVEAGLRANDAMMAEEINRRVVDAVSAVLCAPSKRVADMLRKTHADARVYETGDVAYDVLLENGQRLPSLTEVLPPGIDVPFAYCTLHRAELTSNRDLLFSVLQTLGRLPIPVVLALHPRTREALGGAPLNVGPALHVVPPQGYLESLLLAARAAAVITDSGGVQREAYWFGVPCVTLRRETEWVETVEVGANRLIPPESHARLPDTVRALVGDRRPQWDKGMYGHGQASRRIASAVKEVLDHD